MNRGRGWRYQGFTLLEVMVALSICAMAGIAAMQISGEHINHLSTIEEQTYASWVAENQLVEIRAQGDKWAAKNNHKGKVELAGQTWYWQQKVTRTADSSFVKVDIEVYTDEQYEQFAYTLSTYIDKEAKSNGRR
ncbi:type II secretion system protein GspI [Pseudoalteromonas ruthenica]|uniref:Type II secretion system protein I n=1 Tax=Pseudoalteromonas ruthenica TaxID=151081 RepID=A0A5S3Z302_9GAMM|nr:MULTISPECIES: type II secretion system minor pseudopilin GspI [Pseudoalteromonas]MCF2862533.1 type II secretion system minor pseudopilin GspI [Pseudoalteromonas sp. CNAT2-18]MCG7559015.1 type II secretion system minor pseudopilin GspI [Pseudoalteromonas sp. CNAT2-18.1]MCG7567475.1 type II secretion system minor pseudopilin GspI [Pseudoalteromonas sp. CnMc7-15]RZF80933.1 type II secretion system protein GspI [Pseudoalteromonas sp. CO325X]TLX52217.1 type II secretion system protein GspI [Pseu|tara:strand:- start:2288 stop:2692 length:405 start_codon:yes stop_codon:yes gene_type:complete